MDEPTLHQDREMLICPVQGALLRTHHNSRRTTDGQGDCWDDSRVGSACESDKATINPWNVKIIYMDNKLILYQSRSTDRVDNEE